MAYITWTLENSVEVKEIDDQHKKLFAMLNDFYEKLMAGQGKEVMGKL
ncbi:hemerythrin, partial [bacterium]